MAELFRDAGKVVWNTVATAVVNRGTFENDTKYNVVIVDYDGTRNLKPGRSQGVVRYICFFLGNTILDKKTRKKFLNYKARVTRAMFSSRRQRNGSNFITLPARLNWQHAQ